MKIYIVGTVGSGKSTFAKKLSQQYQIPHYELDNVVWEQHPDGDIKRDKETIQLLFNDIISKENWIIEDVGRSIFNEGLVKADKIIYLNISARTLKRRIFTRWLKQKIGLEKANYKPTINMLKQMNQWCNSDLKKRPSLINKLNTYNNEFICLEEAKINTYSLLK